MTKVQKKSIVTPFAGIFFINNQFSRVSLSKLIDTPLGIRARHFVHGSTFSFVVSVVQETFRYTLRDTMENKPDNDVPGA